MKPSGIYKWSVWHHARIFSTSLFVSIFFTNYSRISSPKVVFVWIKIMWIIHKLIIWIFKRFFVRCSELYTFYVQIHLGATLCFAKVVHAVFYTLTVMVELVCLLWLGCFTGTSASSWAVNMFLQIYSNLNMLINSIRKALIILTRASERDSALYYELLL